LPRLSACQKSSAQEAHLFYFNQSGVFASALFAHFAFPTALGTVLTVLVDVLGCVPYGKHKSVGYNKKCVDTFLK
jgi:hypothetical protein